MGRYEYDVQTESHHEPHTVQLESQFTSIQFPCYGSIYLRDSVEGSDYNHPLPANIDPGESFCLGPSADRSWWVQPQSANMIAEFSKGPCKFIHQKHDQQT